jgi:putative transposase
MIFVDESGFSLVPPLRSTWGRRGQTPLLRHRFSWPKLSAISGVTLDQRLFLRLVRGVINGEEVIEFLRVLLRHMKGPILVLWDNIATHRSGKVKQWLAAHPRFHVEPLPAYAPDLNADEGVWQHLKFSVVGNFCPETIEELEDQIHKGTRTMRKNENLLESFFKRTGLPA